MRRLLSLSLILGTLTAQAEAASCPVSRAVLRFEDGRLFKANGYAAARFRGEQVEFCRPHCGYEASVIRGTVSGRTAYFWTEVSSGMSGGWWSSSKALPRPTVKRRAVPLNWRARAFDAEQLKGAIMHDGPAAGTIQEVRCTGQ